MPVSKEETWLTQRELDKSFDKKLFNFLCVCDVIRGKKSYRPVCRTIGMNNDFAGKADLNICGVNAGRKAQSSKIYCMEMGTEIAKIGKQPHSTKHQT